MQISTILTVNSISLFSLSPLSDSVTHSHTHTHSLSLALSIKHTVSGFRWCTPPFLITAPLHTPATMCVCFSLCINCSVYGLTLWLVLSAKCYKYDRHLKAKLYFLQDSVQTSFSEAKRHLRLDAANSFDSNRFNCYVRLKPFFQKVIPIKNFPIETKSEDFFHLSETQDLNFYSFWIRIVENSENVYFFNVELSQYRLWIFSFCWRHIFHDHRGVASLIDRKREIWWKKCDIILLRH